MFCLFEERDDTWACFQEFQESNIQNMATNEEAVFQASTHQIQELRRSWYHCV
jgi:hypothetical protein